MAFLFQKFQEAVKTLAKSPTFAFARDPRQLQFEVDLNRLFLYTREAASVKSMNERVLDLEEQIRDITIFLEAQKTIDKMSDSNGIKEGTVLPVAHEQPSPGNSKRNRKSGRRRH